MFYVCMFSASEGLTEHVPNFAASNCGSVFNTLCCLSCHADSSGRCSASNYRRSFKDVLLDDHSVVLSFSFNVSQV